jgi:hypothetical protein
MKAKIFSLRSETSPCFTRFASKRSSRFQVENKTKNSKKTKKQKLAKQSTVKKESDIKQRETNKSQVKQIGTEIEK